MLFYICVHVPVLYWSRYNEIRLLPIADKYLLVGDEIMVQKIKTQILGEFAKSTFLNMWYNRKNVDIEIITEENQYNEALKDEKNKDIGLLLCLSADAYIGKKTYFLPDPETSNIKIKNLLLEKIGGEDSLWQNLHGCWSTNPKISKIFKASEIKALSPVIPSVYSNTKLDESRRQFFYFAFAIIVALYSKRKPSPYVYMKKR